MPSDVKVRGCCCGIPFGCGVLLVALVAVLLWRLVVPEGFGLPHAGAGLALVVFPCAALVLVAGRRR